jgi:sugar (pentulose or hexulose) kinase
MQHLGIDIGSSYIKGAVLDADGFQLRHVERLAAPGPVPGLEAGFREIDPDALVSGVVAMLERLADRCPEASGVLVSSQLHGLVLCDARGQALQRCITWQDRRALAPDPAGGPNAFEELERLVTPEGRAQLGNERVPGLPLNALYWGTRHRAWEVADTLPAAIPYYVVSRLCQSEIVSDITHAHATGALDVRSLTWHRDVIGRLGLDGVRWPRLVSQGAVVGEWCHRGRTLPVHAPVGDYHCSQVGTLLEPGEISVNVSTGSAVIRIADGCELGDFQTRPWFDGRYLATVTHLPGGRALQALVGLLTELASAQGMTLGDPWAYLQAEASRAGSGGLVVDPAFYPGNRGDRGSVLGLREENMTVGNLFHATLDGMAGNYAAVAERLCPDPAGRRLVFSGGVALKTELLRRRVQERLGGTHRLAPTDEDTLLGLLVLSLAFSGRSTSVRDAIGSARNHFQRRPRH